MKSRNFKRFMRGLIDPVLLTQSHKHHLVSLNAMQLIHSIIINVVPLCMRSKDGQCDEACKVKTLLITGDHAVTLKPFQVWSGRSDRVDREEYSLPCVVHMIHPPEQSQGHYRSCVTLKVPYNTFWRGWNTSSLSRFVLLVYGMNIDSLKSFLMHCNTPNS